MGKIVITGTGDGTDLDLVTAKASDILKGKVIIGPDGEALTGTIPTIAARTITPGKTNQTVNAGNYLGGNITIAGDADLIAANIKSGKNIFGVAGTCKEIKYFSQYVTSGSSRVSFKNNGEHRLYAYELKLTHNISTIISACAIDVNIRESVVYIPQFEGICFFDGEAIDPLSKTPTIILPASYSNTRYWLCIAGY